MQTISNRKFEVTAKDLQLIGEEIERVLEVIKDYDYGFYNTEDLELKTKLALKIIEGMDEWQWELNKGIRLRGDIHLKIEIYELHELQKRKDEMLKVNPYKVFNINEHNINRIS